MNVVKLFNVYVNLDWLACIYYNNDEQKTMFFFKNDPKALRHSSTKEQYENEMKKLDAILLNKVVKGNLAEDLGLT